MQILIFLCPLVIASGFFYFLNQYNRSYVGYDYTQEILSKEIQFLESLLTKKERAMLDVALSFEKQNLFRKKKILQYYLNSPAELRF